MLKIGVQSKGILDSELLDFETGFERIKKAGFDSEKFRALPGGDEPLF